MLKWFKKPGAPVEGLDYRSVDSRKKAEDLYRQGQLSKLWLLPLEFGGEDIPPNIVYVPGYAAQLKARIDQNTIMPLAQKGQIRRYAATPEYEGKSFVPSQIKISATDPGHFEATVAIWGKAVQQSEVSQSRPDAQKLEFAPTVASLVGLGPEDVVNAWLADYKAWNDWAHSEAEKRGDEAPLDYAEGGYDKLIEKYCRPGFKHEPIAFGSDASHSPDRERITSIDSKGQTTVVHTEHNSDFGSFVSTHKFEYHLSSEGHRWFLEQIYLVDKDGRYESL